MYRVALGQVSALSAGTLSDIWVAQAPGGARCLRWLAGRALLSQLVAPAALPDIIEGENGKPFFAGNVPLWFNLSHSGDHIAAIVSDEGEVGCDLEVIRPRENWPRIARAVFSKDEQAELHGQSAENALPTFWQIWTKKEAILKRSGQSVWAMAQVNSADSDPTCVHHCVVHNSLSLALCTSTPFAFTSAHIEIYS